MSAAVGWALFAAIQPLGIIAFIALLGSRGGRRNALGFIIGWMLCGGVVAVLTIELSDVHHNGGGASQVVSSAGLLQIFLGICALALLVVRRRRGRGARLVPGRSESPGGASQRGAVGPFGAALIAALLQGWPIVAAAVAAATKATEPGAARVLAIAVVIVASTSTYLVAYVLSGLNPERTAATLERLRLWIETHRDTAIDLVLVAVGLWLVGHGLMVQLSR